MAFTEEGKFFASREEMVKYVKYIGQFILDNAEDIVGNYHSMTGIDVIGHADVESLPTVHVQRDHIVGNWNIRRKNWHDEQSDDGKRNPTEDH